MTLDLSGIPAIDVHCHPFLNRGAVTANEFTDLTAFGGGSRKFMDEAGAEWTDALDAELQRVKRDTVYFRRMVRDLAGFFGTAPDLDAVLEARNRAVAEDYTGYVRRLYADAGLVALVADFGIPLPMLDPAQVQAEMPVPVVPIVRIEPLIAEMLKTDIGWAEFSRRFDDAIADALTNRGYRGVKSIIAYRTGLEVSPLSRTADQGLKALDAIRRGLGGNSMKMLRDHLLCRSLELCMEHDVPMQIHTGMGDFEVNLPLCRPAYLMDLLRFPTFRACRVILVHGGYPYVREAAYITQALPRVYCDVSEGIPFAGHGARAIFAEALELAPVSKVVYGSDGFSLPEINYTSAKLGRQALGQVLAELVEDRMLDEAEAMAAARMILHDTTAELYRIG